MAKISLICEQCGGNIILDNSHEIGTCEHCFSQFVIKQDQIGVHGLDMLLPAEIEQGICR